jgi:hypothetical protein
MRPTNYRIKHLSISGVQSPGPTAPSHRDSSPWLSAGAMVPDSGDFLLQLPAPSELH